MDYVILLDKNAKIREVVTEEQTRFVVSVIEALEVPFEWNSNEPFTIFDKVRLRKALSQYNISVIDDMDGGVKIYLERELIGEFFKPSYLLKEDYQEIDPHKKLFIEMKCKFSSVFEDASPE